MGATQSRPHALDELSVEDVSSFVSGLGAKYQVYGEAISANAVDGELLASIDLNQDAEAAEETLECLEITNFLHRRVLLKEWKKARATMMDTALPDKKNTVKEPATFVRTETSYTDASDITTETAEMTADVSSLGNSQQRAPVAVSQGDLQETQDELNAPNEQSSRPPLTITLQHRAVLEALEIPRSLEKLPVESEMLGPYRETVSKMQARLQANMAAINLLNVEEGKGVNSLAATLCQPDGTGAMRTRLHFDQPPDKEYCQCFILNSDEDFHVVDIPRELSEAFGMTENATYYAHVVHHGNLRVGTVCVVLQETPGKATTMEEKKNILKFLAKETEDNLDQRKKLLLQKQRNEHLKQEIELLKKSQEDNVVAPAYGPLKAVLNSQITSRQILFPYPMEPQRTDRSVGGCTTANGFTRKSSQLSSWLPHLQANEEERDHLGPEFYDTENNFPVETVIGKRDIERVAMLNSLAILDIDPLSQQANNIQALVNMAAKLMDVEVAFINANDHQHRHLLFPTFIKGADAVSSTTRMFLEQTHQTTQRRPDGSAFCLRAARSNSICNYTNMSPNHQAFVVHDLAKDESLYAYKTLADIGFYAGASIVVRGQPVAALCCCSRDPRPSFERVQEVQLEQFAQLIAQEFESWALGAEMGKLEHERKLLLGNSVKSGQQVLQDTITAPEDYAVLVLSNVQGFEALWEANADATDAALETHNEIIRTIAAENGGYEVNAYRGFFQLAFGDVVDAVNFCLQAQEALHNASWSKEILSIPEACEDTSSAFRGLRVQMAAHCGEVKTSKENGRVTYSGESVQIVKSLQSMGHGGQVLVTSDVWNIASQMLENTMQSSQVLDLGLHVMSTKSAHTCDGITNKEVLQLLPASLAHDYLQSRRSGSEDKQPLQSQGRMFPPLKSRKALKKSFHEAPYKGNSVALVSIDASKVRSLVEDPSMLLSALSNRIASILVEDYPGGYQCEDFKIAFAELSDAVRFGLDVQGNLAHENVLDFSLKNCLKIGVQEGIFETMGPDSRTGKAKYIGGVVTTGVAGVAQETVPGCVYLGRKYSAEDAFMLQPVTNGFMQEFMGTATLKEIQEEFSMFKCQPCRSWYDQMQDKRNDMVSLRSPWRTF